MELNKWIHKYVADDKMQEELNKWDLEIAEDKGFEQGIKQGIEQGIEQRNIEIVKAMLESNVPIKDIIKYTNLSMEEIKQLKKEEN